MFGVCIKHASTRAVSRAPSLACLPASPPTGLPRRLLPPTHATTIHAGSCIIRKHTRSHPPGLGAPLNAVQSPLCWPCLPAGVGGWGARCRSSFTSSRRSVRVVIAPVVPLQRIDSQLSVSRQTPHRRAASRSQPPRLASDMVPTATRVGA